MITMITVGDVFFSQAMDEAYHKDVIGMCKA